MPGLCYSSRFLYTNHDNVGSETDTVIIALPGGYSIETMSPTVAIAAQMRCIFKKVSVSIAVPKSILKGSVHSRLGLVSRELES